MYYRKMWGKRIKNGDKKKMNRETTLKRSYAPCPKIKSKNYEKKSKEGVDFRRKCGITNKLSRKTAALQKPNKSDAPAKTQRGTGQRAGGKLLKRHLEGSKKYRKKCLTKSTTFDIMIELSERRASRTLKIEQY